MNPLRILLADDHNLVRAGMRSLLETFPDVSVVAETGDGREAVELAAAQQPDIVLMDIAMPGLNGLEATARIVKDHPRVRVVILSMHANEDYVRHALRAGAVGYLLKDAAPVELELALKAVMRGETWLSPAVSKGMVEDFLRRGAETPTSFERLTPRQREILQLVAEGHSTKDIARRLDLSIKTVESHRTALMKTLDLHDVAGLVRYALQVGLIAPQQ